MGAISFKVLLASSEFLFLNYMIYQSNKGKSELRLPSLKKHSSAVEERPQQLAAGTAALSAAAGLLSGVCGFPKHKTRWDFATAGCEKECHTFLRLRSLLKT